MCTFERVMSGHPGLDTLLDNIRIGDNVVWQVSSMEEYLFFVQPYVRQAVADGRNILYMHFTGCGQLLDESDGVRVYEFNPAEGFEAFTVSVRRRITAEGRDAFYVFDCLSELQMAWATDLMMGNFFQVTCPYLFELNTVAYFPVLRGRHSFDAIARIRETTQLLLDVYRSDSELYIHPLKVWNRYSSTMFLPHRYMAEKKTFSPLRGGYEVSGFYALVDTQEHLYENQNLDSWERFVSETRRIYRRQGEFSAEAEDKFARNMISGDEQILALVIQRVSGSMYEDFLMPSAAGVGYSYSAYRWNDAMDPAAGMLRLVMGLGTRAVDRTEGDYPRMISLDCPESSVLTGSWEKHQYSQRYVDMIDYAKGGLSARPLGQVTPYMDNWYKRMVLEHDFEAERSFQDRGQYREILFANCQGLVCNRQFTDCMQSVLHTLQEAYRYPVDIEFTVNGSPDGEFVYNLLQCRPLQTGTQREAVEIPKLPPEKTVFSVVDSSMGGSRAERIDYIVWVDAIAYYQYPYKQKPDIARVIGEINQQLGGQGKKLMLFVPGRIGTSSPELGVPVTFAQIHHFCAVCEMAEKRAGYMPELSYGSHMFQDLVEAEIFYTAIFGNEKTLLFHDEYFAKDENKLTELLPSCGKYTDLVKLYDVQEKNVVLYSDLRNEKTVLGEIEK